MRFYFETEGNKIATINIVLKGNQLICCSVYFCIHLSVQNKLRKAPWTGREITLFILWDLYIKGKSTPSD